MNGLEQHAGGRCGPTGSGENPASMLSHQAPDESFAPAHEETKVDPAILRIYSSRDEVVSELERRWADKDLAEEVCGYLEGHVLPPLAHGPRAILSRHVATPDHEFNAFVAHSRALGLSPLHVEFPGDVFTTNNRGKVCLVKMTFYHGLEGRGGNARISHLRVVEELERHENQPLTGVRTAWGEFLVDFHHRLLREYHTTDVYDASRWFRQIGSCAKTYYPKYLALLALRHVLFENFEPGREERFFHEIMLPSFELVHKRFGMKPLILPVAPPGEMNDYFWWSYPEEVKPLVEKSSCPDR